MVGRKLLVTGNGRCNISNDGAAPSDYVCDDPRFMAELFDRCSRADTVARLAELGILTYATADGWRYPLSDSAAAVTDILAAGLELAGGSIAPANTGGRGAVCGRWLRPDSGRAGHTVHVDRLVAATGGMAYPALGSKGEFLPVLAALGHTIVPPTPALVPLLADIRPVHKLQGVRLDCAADPLCGGRPSRDHGGQRALYRYGAQRPGRHEPQPSGQWRRRRIAHCGHGPAGGAWRRSG